MVGTCGRPRTVTTWMVRTISGSISGRTATRHGHGIFGMKVKPSPPWPCSAPSRRGRCGRRCAACRPARGRCARHGRRTRIAAVDVGLVAQVGAAHGIVLVEGMARPTPITKRSSYRRRHGNARRLLGWPLDRDIELALRQASCSWVLEPSCTTSRTFGMALAEACRKGTKRRGPMVHIMRASARHRRAWRSSWRAPWRRRSRSAPA